ncbi:MAG TPA: ABC-type transport auxiliary lipoprotein family protein [Steroidobacteraceae bacterium]
MSLARRRRWPARKFAAALAALPLALSGCTGSLFKSKEPPQAVYVLTVVPAPATAGAEIPADLTLLRPQVRPGIDTSQIAALYPDHRLDHFAGARWSGPLDEVLQNFALQAFRADAGVRNVHTDASAFGTGYWLEIDVADFQAEYGGPKETDSGPPTVHVHLVARLGTSGDRRVVGQFEADVREPASDNRLTAIVQAYNRAASAAFARIVADTGQTLGRK